MQNERRPVPKAPASAAVALSSVSDPEVDRIQVGIAELDRVLGGGIVPGSLVLVGGEPGVGKSTLLLQAAAGVAAGGPEPRSVLYVTGEESAAQIRLRAGRLGLATGVAGTSIAVLAEGEVGRIAEVARATPPRSSSSTRSRPSPSTSSMVPQAASARSGSRPCA